MSASNYPPGMMGGIADSDDAVPHKCKNGHEWTAPMFSELGGWFYYNDDDAVCPECGEADDDEREEME